MIHFHVFCGENFLKKVFPTPLSKTFKKGYLNCIMRFLLLPLLHIISPEP